MSTTHQHNDGTEYGQPSNITKHPPEIPANRAIKVGQKFPFFDLHPELRNRVYMFALATDDGLISHCDGLNSFFVTKEPEEPSNVLNQLQFVCKQMRKETQWLELKYNTVNFPQNTLKRLRLTVFEWQLNADQRSRLSSIRIHQPFRNMLLARAGHSFFATAQPYDVLAFMWLQLFKFCERNSHVKVQVTLPDWSHSPASNFKCNYYGTIGCQIAALAGREDMVRIIATNSPFMALQIHQLADARSARQRNGLTSRFKDVVRNITLFPGISNEEKAEVISTNGTILIGRKDGQQANSSDTDQVWAEKWLPLGISWVMDGIQLG